MFFVCNWSSTTGEREKIEMLRYGAAVQIKMSNYGGWFLRHVIQKVIGLLILFYFKTLQMMQRNIWLLYGSRQTNGLLRVLIQQK